MNLGFLWYFRPSWFSDCLVRYSGDPHTAAKAGFAAATVAYTAFGEGDLATECEKYSADVSLCDTDEYRLKLVLTSGLRAAVLELIIRQISAGSDASHLRDYFAGLSASTSTSQVCSRVLVRSYDEAMIDLANATGIPTN